VHFVGLFLSSEELILTLLCQLHFLSTSRILVWLDFPNILITQPPGKLWKVYDWKSHKSWNQLFSNYVYYILKNSVASWWIKQWSVTDQENAWSFLLRRMNTFLLPTRADSVSFLQTDISRAAMFIRNLLFQDFLRVSSFDGSKERDSLIKLSQKSKRVGNATFLDSSNCRETEGSTLVSGQMCCNRP